MKLKKKWKKDVSYYRKIKELFIQKKIKDNINFVGEFVLKEVYIFALKEENGHYIAEVYLDVEFYDYVENIKKFAYALEQTWVARSKTCAFLATSTTRAS